MRWLSEGRRSSRGTKFGASPMRLILPRLGPRLDSDDRLASHEADRAADPRPRFVALGFPSRTAVGVDLHRAQIVLDPRFSDHDHVPTPTVVIVPVVAVGNDTTKSRNVLVGTV